MIARNALDKSLDGLKTAGAWFLLAGLAGMVAYQVYNAFLLIGLLAINVPALRPSGWSTQSLTPLGRLTVLLLGILWLGFVAGLEGYLRDWRDEGVLARRVSRVAVILCVIYVALDAAFLLFAGRM